MDTLGYDYEKFQTVTKDYFKLTMFRIVGPKGEVAENEAAETSGNAKRSLLFMHGSMMDAETWMQYQATGGRKPLFLQLVDQGYDVWMGNGRGTKYSNGNDRYYYADSAFNDGQTKMKYNYSFVEMGKYDLNSMVKIMREQNPDNKVTYIGYQQSTTSMLYALTQDKDASLSSAIDKAIFLAPCLFPATLGAEKYDSFFS